MGRRLQHLPLLSVRARLFATTLALIVTAELLSGFVFQSRLSSWLFTQHIERSERAAREVERSVRRVAWRSDSLRGERWIAHLSEALDARISLLSADGSLIYDSDPDPSNSVTAERRLSFEEVINARDQGFGSGRRRVNAGGAELIFAVVPTYQESGALRGYIRLATPTRRLDDQISYLNSVLWSIFAMSLGLALLISGWAAQMLSQTLRRLETLARELARGERGQKLTFEGKDEYSRLARSLTMLASQIESQVGHLAESRDRFEAVLDAMREAVIALDTSRRISFANVSACQLLGWSNPPLGCSLEECVREDALILFLRDGVAEDDPWVELEFNGRRTVLARLTSQSIVGETVLVLSDITALRRLETVRRDFVANVSHELRTPTTVIQANAETLMDGAIDDPEVAESFLRGIFRNAQRLARLVSDLLDLSRIESGTYHMRREPVHIREVLERVVDTLADQLIAKSIKIKLKLDAVNPQPDLYTDAGALEQIFTNLIENAVHYSDERASVSVKVTPQQGAHEQTLLFEVVDNGPGIAKKHQSRIFERFYRVDKGRSRQLGGTGLGLAIVKHLCGALGGDLGLKSVKGEGCRFWFTLPLMGAEIAVDPLEDSSAEE